MSENMTLKAELEKDLEVLLEQSGFNKTQLAFLVKLIIKLVDERTKGKFEQVENMLKNPDLDFF